jgi:hypothetical protein
VNYAMGLRNSLIQSRVQRHDRAIVCNRIAPNRPIA